MAHPDIIRAWKDEAYRLSLSAAEQALVPDNPAGRIELTDTELDAVAGGLPPSIDFCYTDYFGCQFTYDCFTVDCFTWYWPDCTWDPPYC